MRTELEERSLVQRSDCSSSSSGHTRSLSSPATTSCASFSVVEESQSGSMAEIQYGSILQRLNGEKAMLFFGERYLSCWQERGGGWAWHDHEYAVTRPYYTVCKIFYPVTWCAMCFTLSHLPYYTTCKIFYFVILPSYTLSLVTTTV